MYKYLKLYKCNFDHLEGIVGDTLNSYKYFISHHPTFYTMRLS